MLLLLLLISNQLIKMSLNLLGGGLIHITVHKGISIPRGILTLWPVPCRIRVPVRIGAGK
jgi:hypothetical protein